MSKKEEEGCQELFSAGMIDRFRAQRFPEEIRFAYWGREFVASLRANNVNCVVVPNEDGSGTCVILTAQRRVGLL